MDESAFSLLEQPVPPISTGEAARLATELFGIAGPATELEGERDRNFRIDTPDGGYALKFAHPHEGASILSMQAAALEHLARVDPSLPVPRSIRTVAGEAVTTVTIDEVAVPVRLVGYLAGRTLRQGETSPQLRTSITDTLARLQRGLRGFFHPSAGRTLLWDLVHLSSLRNKLDYLQPERRRLNELWLDRFDDLVDPVLPSLPAQVIHNDFNPENLITDDGSAVSGIIDFGDMVHGPVVADLAVAIGYQVLGDQDPVSIIGEMTDSFSSRHHLEAPEIESIPVLVAGRLVQSLIIGEWRAALHPDNIEYILGYSDSTWEALQRLSEHDPKSIIERIRHSARSRGTASAALAKRRQRFGSGLELSYQDPIRATSAEGVWIYGADGRRYLDAYNNVPQVGHSRAEVAEAIARQSARLNTNTRYLVDEVIGYADRIAGLFPDSLDIVWFTNSGSEANDLAWRIAMTVTGRRGFVVTDHAYHGSTYLTMATSPEEAGRANLEPWVGTIPAPSSNNVPGAAEASVRATIDGLTGRGFAPAGLAVDTIFSSDGIFDPPPEFIAEIARGIREAGGLFIADEVQAGFGRVGERFWGFAGSSVVPDIVTLGKPMGNGHPVAATVTTPEIAEAFFARDYFFSTFGGNPVATAAGNAVLDVIEADDLAVRAEAVGAELRAGLTGLQSTYDEMRDVRGAGLFTGVEVADGDVATELMEALRRRGVLIGRTGPSKNVLKIRPPLVFESEHVAILLERLEDALRELR